MLPLMLSTSLLSASSRGRIAVGVPKPEPLCAIIARSLNKIKVKNLFLKANSGILNQFFNFFTAAHNCTYFFPYIGF
jgi:hypothetical protein